jgi:hypothetical protein
MGTIATLAKIVLSLTRIKSMPPELRKSLQTNAEWVIHHEKCNLGTLERLTSTRMMRDHRIDAIACQTWFVIALPSPNRVNETGLRMCPLEKGLQIDAFDPEQSVLSGSLC